VTTENNGPENEADEKTPASPGFGERLRAERKRAGVSLQWVADELGVNRKTIYRYECEGRMPAADTIEALALALKVDPAALRDGTSSPVHGRAGLKVVSSVADASSPNRGKRRGNMESRALEELSRGMERVPFLSKRIDEADRLEEAGESVPLTREDYLRLTARSPRVLAFRVRGDTMRPSIEDGDLVFIGMDASAAGGACAIANEGRVEIGIVHRKGRDVRVTFENTLFEPFALDPESDSVRVLGRVLAVLRHRAI
jgi:transcriptional regulator with XRE-family HTH domain